MQQYFGDNFDINEDPIRKTYMNQTHDSLNTNPLLPQPNENPLLPTDDKSNLNNTINNVFLKEVTKPSTDFDIIPRLKQNDDINTYNNEINRFNNLSQEILEKEKELMESKGETIKLKNELEYLNEEVKKINILEYENKELNKKINELIKERSIIIDARETNDLLLKEIDKYKNEINKLNFILSKNNIDVYDETDENDKSITTPQIKKFKKNKATKINKTNTIKNNTIKTNTIKNNNIKTNNTKNNNNYNKTNNTKNNNKLSQIDSLKVSLLNHYPSYSKEKLDKMFEELEINNDINITRDLLTAITGYMEI